MTKPKIFIIGVNHFYQQPIEMILLRNGGIDPKDYPFYAKHFSIENDHNVISNHFIEMIFRISGKFLTYAMDLVVKSEARIVFEEGFSDSKEEDNSMIKKAIQWKFMRISSALPQYVQVDPDTKDRESVNGNDYSIKENWCFSKDNTEEIINWREGKWIDKIKQNLNKDMPPKAIVLITGYCHLDGVFAYKDIKKDQEIFFPLEQPLEKKLTMAGFDEIIKIGERDIWEKLDPEYWNYRKAKNDQWIFEER